MSLSFGPQRYDVVPTASQVSVVRWPSEELASLSAPVTVDAQGAVSFTVSEPGPYLVIIKTPLMQIRDQVTLIDTEPYDITDPRSYADSKPDVDSSLPAALEARAEVISEAINVISEGCAGDNVTDDTLAFSAAFEKFLSPVGGDRPGRLVIPGGRTIYLPNGYSKIFNTALAGGIIEGGGAIRTDTGEEYALKIESGASTGWRQFTIQDIRFINAGLWLKSTTATGATTPQFDLNRLTVQSVTANHGILLDGVFECRITSPNVTMATSVVDYDGIHGRDGTGVLSSVDIINPNCRYGRSGIRGLKDFKVVGGTVLYSQTEGVRVDSALGALVLGTHVENCWQSVPDAGSAGATVDDRAGVKVVGYATVQDVYAVQADTSYRMSHAVSVFANSRCQVIGGHGTRMKTYLHVFGSAGSQVVGIGVQSATVHYNFTNVLGGRYINLAGTASGPPIEIGGSLSLASSIPNVTGGSNVDAEARAAIDAILVRLRNLGLASP